MPEPSIPSPPPDTPQDAFDPKWPGDPNAAWPQGCIVWDVGQHPELPWVTLACNKDDFGAILVLDARSGSMISATTSDETTAPRERHGPWVVARWPPASRCSTIRAPSPSSTSARPSRSAKIDAPEPKPPKGIPDWAVSKEPFAGDTKLLWVATDRFAVVGSYYAAIYAMDGSRVAQFIVPF